MNQNPRTRITLLSLLLAASTFGQATLQVTKLQSGPFNYIVQMGTAYPFQLWELQSSTNMVDWKFVTSSFPTTNRIVGITNGTQQIYFRAVLKGTNLFFP